MSEFSGEYYEANGQDADRPALAWYARVCRRLAPAGSRVVDFGCGTGWYAKHLAVTFDVIGVDVSEYARAATKRRTPSVDVVAGLESIPDDSVDLVTSLHTFEHIADPQPVMNEVSRVLRPGGTLMFTVPATEGLGRRLRGDAWFAFSDPTHVSLLPQAAWRAYCIRAGLDVVRTAGDGLWDPPYVKAVPRPIQLATFGSMAALQVYAARGRLMIPARWSENLIVIARRPDLMAALGNRVELPTRRGA